MMHGKALLITAVSKVFAKGHKNRVVAATSVNDESSRSHTLFSIQVTKNNLTTGIRTMGKIGTHYSNTHIHTHIYRFYTSVHIINALSCST